jgi:3-methyladenine DNA glycosylase AlkC
MALPEIQNRKPARTIAQIPKEVHSALSKGLVPTKNLVEWLSTDRKVLCKQVCQEIGIDPKSQGELWTTDLKSQSALKQSFAIGHWLAGHCQVGDDSWRPLSSHVSDIVREWSAIVIGVQSNLTFPRKLAWIKPLADDEHAGLREIAWLALRSEVIRDPQKAIAALVPWTGSRSERLRRYASEITRPCGVWTTHIGLLKERPELGLAILEPLQCDDAKYVRDSVGNWLNDASKSRPDWVRSTVQQWLTQSDHPNTQSIAKRALRTLVKQGNGD